MNVTGVVLAGGKSRRMGHNKSLMQLDDEPILSRVLQVLEPITESMLLVTNTPEAYAAFGLDMVPDVRPGFGALGGIYTALKHAHHAHALVVACDMPFLSPAVLVEMMRAADEADVVVPFSGKGYEPLCALYGEQCVEPIEALMNSGERKIDRLYPEVRVRVFTPEEWRPLDPLGHTFFNVNTPEDYAAAEEILKMYPR